MKEIAEQKQPAQNVQMNALEQSENQNEMIE